MQLALNLDKTFLGVQKGVLLGYVVSEKEREPDCETKPPTLKRHSPGEGIDITFMFP